MSITKLLNIRFPIFQGAMAELATVECPTHENFKKAVIDAIDAYTQAAEVCTNLDASKLV